MLYSIAFISDLGCDGGPHHEKHNRLKIVRYVNIVVLKIQSDTTLYTSQPTKLVIVNAFLT